MSDYHAPGDVLASPLLHRWLRPATRSLCPTAAERVRAEISAHFLAEVIERMDRDEPQMAAEEAAIRGLGNARAARRRLLETDLTNGEA